MTTKKGKSDPRSYMTEEFLNCAKKLRLMDDVFMCMCFSDRSCVEYVLRVIMDKTDLKVEDVEIQHEIKNLTGRSVCLDIKATDEAGNRYNIEIQRNNGGAIPKRARYHAAMMDYTALKKRENFEKLKETYIIFITENDIFSKRKPLYTIDRQIKETGEPFRDGMHIIYVNGEVQDVSNDLGRLMHDMQCVEPDDMYSKVLSDRAGFFKKSQEGVANMCKELDDMLKRAENRAEKRGEKRGERRGEKIGEKRGVKLGEKIGEERGRNEARTDIIINYINRCKAGGKSEEVIISDLEQYFDYSGTEARKMYEKYVG